MVVHAARLLLHVPEAVDFAVLRAYARCVGPDEYERAARRVIKVPRPARGRAGGQGLGVHRPAGPAPEEVAQARPYAGRPRALPVTRARPTP